MRQSNINKTKKRKSNKKKYEKDVPQDTSKDPRLSIASPLKEKFKSTNIWKIDFSPVKDNLRQTNNGSRFKMAIQNAIWIQENREEMWEESKFETGLAELIEMSDNNMAFSIFPPNTIKEVISDNITPEERCKLLDVILSFLKSTKKIQDKLHQWTSFSKFILAFLDKAEEECIPKLLNLLKIVIDNGCLNSGSNLEHIFKGIVKHLGSKNIDIRQDSMRIFISIMKNMQNKVFIDTSIQYLNSNNWRIREEILNLIIINMLNQIDPDFDYDGVIKCVSKLVNDDNAKVRFVSREALAIMANKGDREKVLDLWGQLVVHNEYLKLSDRLLTNTIMTFNEKNLMFEYPKQPIQQKTLEKARIKIRHSPENLKRNSKIKNQFSHQKVNIADLNPQGDDQLSDYLANTIDKNRKETMISFSKSDYTEADTIFAKTKNINPRKIRLKSVVKTHSPQKLSNRSHIQSELNYVKANK